MGKGQPEFQSKTSHKQPKHVAGGVGGQEMKARKFNPMVVVDNNNFWPEYGMDSQSIQGLSAQMNSNEFVAVSAMSPDAKQLLKKKMVMPTIPEPQARGTSIKKGSNRGGVIEPFKRKLSRPFQ
jgi:hypothetical protein